MKIVQINTSCGVGSTGKICVAISELLTKKNIENYILYSVKTNGYALGISCSDDKYIKRQALKSKLLGNYGFNSNKATRKMIFELDKINPDVVHLHNIHSHDCNIEMLCEYLKHKNMKVYWTFHDCWAVTGYCPYFTMVKCEKWRIGCEKCCLHKSYSWLWDKSSELYNKKKAAIQGLDLTIITPSQWLANIIKSSFLQEYQVNVINNGIDLNIFKLSISDFKKKYQIENKKMILCVANEWEKRKGLDILIMLSQKMSDEYRVVLVGTNKRIDRCLPADIISIHRTNNQQELAEIYTAADVFVNPTREDNYPTVNIEAISCGTPVVTFRTGGSAESVIEGKTGFVVECDDIDAMMVAIKKACLSKEIMMKNCLEEAKNFDMVKCFAEYIKLYEYYYKEKNNRYNA